MTTIVTFLFQMRKLVTRVKLVYHSLKHPQLCLADCSLVIEERKTDLFITTVWLSLSLLHKHTHTCVYAHSLPHHSLQQLVIGLHYCIKLFLNLLSAGHSVLVKQSATSQVSAHSEAAYLSYKQESRTRAIESTEEVYQLVSHFVQSGAHSTAEGLEPWVAGVVVKLISLIWQSIGTLGGLHDHTQKKQKSELSQNNISNF